MTKQEKSKLKADARIILVEAYGLKNGATIYGQTFHRSASGMTRHIQLLHVQGQGVQDVSKAIAQALGWTYKEGQGLVVHGCGFDPVEHAVSALAYELGFKELKNSRL